MLTQERLKELLDYNPETGVFVWRVSKGPCKAGSVAGTVNNNGYVHIKIERKLHQAHRLAWLYTYGCWPDKDIVHINRMKTDNRIENLRDTDKNDWNRDKHSNNTSGYPGVSWDKRSKKWRAKITVSGKQMHLGLFNTPEAANAAYMAAKEKLHIID
jgi:hypothetical protein